MLVKKLNFDETVLQELRSMEWSDNGLLGKISRPLDRALYVRVNKALEVMGGKWNRSKGGHVFAFDPRSSVDGLLQSGILEVEKDGFFETPIAVIDRMFELCPLPSDTDHFKRMPWILEPEAGAGAILDRILENLEMTCVIHAIEKNDNRREALIAKYAKTAVTVQSNDHVADWDGKDFLEYNPFVSGAGSRAVYVKPGYDRVYMKPPFEEGQDAEHVYHAYQLLEPGGMMVSVVSSGMFFRTDKKTRQLRDWLFSVGGHFEELPKGSFRESGTDVNTCLVSIKKQEETGSNK